MNGWKESLKRSCGGRWALLPYRGILVLRRWTPPVRTICHWLFASREITNLTYNQTDRGKDVLAHLVVCATGTEYSLVRQYVSELDSDDLLRRHVRAAI